MEQLYGYVLPQQNQYCLQGWGMTLNKLYICFYLLMATVREHNSPETHFNKFAFQSQLSDPHIKHRPLVLRRSINKKMMKTERSSKAPPMSPATRLNTSINDRNQT
jgi:hypothetical protein